MLSITSGGSQASSQVVQADASAQGTETLAHRKLRKAAQEFESMLISQLLGESGVGLSSLGGDTPLAGSQTLNSLAIQTLSTAMAGRGGFGIAKMLVDKLGPSADRGSHAHSPAGH